MPQAWRSHSPGVLVCPAIALALVGIRVCVCVHVRSVTWHVAGFAVPMPCA
jgi:hypothetical protein